MLVGALEPRAGRRLLSIASGGDNALALLATGADVVAADVSAAQLALVELKCAAFRRLSHERLLAFLGVRDAADRLEVYDLLRRDLSPAVGRFWDGRPDDVLSGVINIGKFENYFRIFRSRVLPLIHSDEAVRRLLDEKSREERFDFYEGRWNNWRWKLLFRIFFSRTVMGSLGRDSEKFRHVRGPVSAPLLARARHALTVLPTHDNHFLEYILTGRFERTLPSYLEPGSFDAIRAGLERLTLFHGTVEEAAARHGGAGFDGYNLSDIFEYVDVAAFRGMGGALLSAARRGARLAYWNMLVPRKLAGEFPQRLRPLKPLAERGFREDRAFFYSAFVLEEVAA